MIIKIIRRLISYFIFFQLPKITLEQDSFIRRQSHLSDFEQIFFADFEGSASQEHFKKIRFTMFITHSSSCKTRTTLIVNYFNLFSIK
uniref:Candidate secreted effector n=1 Tax=Meloidogyne incognita TaxID=6306 RepID=A0A914N9T9_MELIC